MDQHIDSQDAGLSAPPNVPVRFMPHWTSVVMVAWPWFATLGIAYGIAFVLHLMPPFDVFLAASSPILAIVMTGGVIVSLIRAYLAWRFSSAFVYEDRVVYYTGFTSIRETTVELGEIAIVDVRQTLMQRLFSAGDVMIDSRAASILAIRGVANAPALRDLIRQRRNRQ